MSAYYNEIEPYAAEWLRNLIVCELIADGEVDTRSIEDIRPVDLAGFTQCHFFAGIGVWSHALRLAGWPDDRPIWTGSCPCQPFSAAGEGRGFDDERHLWPAFHYLIEQCRPPVVVGEQVASKDADLWVDLVQTDVETLGYAFGAVPFPAASVGAPHIRDRLYWVAYADRRRSESGAALLQPDHSVDGGPAGGEALANTAGRGCRVVGSEARAGDRGHADSGFAVGGVANSGGAGLPLPECEAVGGAGRRQEGGAAEQRRGPLAGFWVDAEWVWCRDGRWRPHGPESFPLALADGFTCGVGPSRTGTLRAYGNAICAPQAIEWIKAVMSCRP